jgi:hypothetical protein
MRAPSARRRWRGSDCARSLLRRRSRSQFRSRPIVAPARRTSERIVQPALSARSPAIALPSARRPGSRQSGKLTLPSTRARSKRGVVSSTQRKNHRLSATTQSRRSMRPSIQAPTICSLRASLRPAPDCARWRTNAPRTVTSTCGTTGRRRPTRAISPFRQACSSSSSPRRSGSKSRSAGSGAAVAGVMEVLRRCGRLTSVSSASPW